MHSLSKTLIKALVWLAVGMTTVVVFHLGGSFAHVVGQFAPLTGAFIGGCLTLASACLPVHKKERIEPWIGLEQVSWILVGFGMIMWGIGDSFWRYYVSIGQTPFPSLADIGYSTFPILAFTGLLLQPASNAKSKRVVLLMDSLISMGSILAIAWYLLLGSLAQAPGEANLAKFLGIYYPTSDMALLSCIVFLLLRGQGRTYLADARRVSLLVVGLGFAFFVASDFLFNVQNNAGTYIEATWVDLGWPIGMLTIGIAAYLRRFLPATPEGIIQERLEARAERGSFSMMQFLPYFLLALLFLALTMDVLANDPGQRAIRPVLLFATLGVVALVIVRQVMTLRDNMQLALRQADSLIRLAQANERVEEQSQLIAEHNAELEGGIEHLKDVQASLANGNLRARAHLSKGALLPLAGSLNLMADRLTRLGQQSAYAQHLVRALGELSIAFERYAAGAPFVVPESCSDMTEINRLLVAMRMKKMPAMTQMPPSQPGTYPLASAPPSPRPATQPLSPLQPLPPLPRTEPLPQRSTGEPVPQRSTGDGYTQQSGTHRIGARQVLGLRQTPASSPLPYEPSSHQD